MGVHAGRGSGVAASSAMTQPEQPVVKDEDAEHAIASAWRPTFRAIVSAFVVGDFRLGRGIASVEPVSESTAKQIRDYVADYGETLVELPEESWKTSVAQWMGTHWDVLVDLWTLGEGRSDLVLGARVYETETGYRYQIGIVYVP
jgi:hypothetical protein